MQLTLRTCLMIWLYFDTHALQFLVDLVKFLSRLEDENSTHKLSFGRHCLEMPAISALGLPRLFAERPRYIAPGPLSISNMVEELGYSTNHARYLTCGADVTKELSKVSFLCFT